MILTISGNINNKILEATKMWVQTPPLQYIRAVLIPPPIDFNNETNDATGKIKIIGYLREPANISAEFPYIIKHYISQKQIGIYVGGLIIVPKFSPTGKIAVVEAEYLEKIKETDKGVMLETSSDKQYTGASIAIYDGKLATIRKYSVYVNLSHGVSYECIETFKGTFQDLIETRPNLALAIMVKYNKEQQDQPEQGENKEQ